jgi:hypothetical protein
MVSKRVMAEFPGWGNEGMVAQSRQAGAGFNQAVPLRPSLT